MTVTAKNCLVDVRHIVHDAFHQVVVFGWIGKSGGIGNINDGRTGVNYCFNDSINIVKIRSTGVFHKILNVIGILACALNGFNPGFKCFVFRHSELVDQVVFADTKTGMNSPSFGRLQCLGGYFDVLLPSASETTNSDAFEFGCKLMNAFEVARR